jgi:cardiolipin synthase
MRCGGFSLFGPLSFSLAVFIVNTESAVEYKVAWLVMVGVLPLIGSILYLFFAHKLRTKKEKKRLKEYYAALAHEPTNPEVSRHLLEQYPEAASVSHYLEEASNGAVYSNSRVEYFPLGDLAFPSMLREIKKARHYIFIEYFIITPGEFWDSLLAVLREKANEGLDVRVVYDDVGNLGSTPVRYWNDLRGYGIKAYAFSRIKPILDIRMNNRDHRKILVIDGHTGFTGGINLADEYINKISKYGHWKDNAIMIKGKAVYGLTLLFLANWFLFFEHGKPIDYDYYRPERYIDEDEGFPRQRWLRPALWRYALLQRRRGGGGLSLDFGEGEEVRLYLHPLSHFGRQTQKCPANRGSSGGGCADFDPWRTG